MFKKFKEMENLKEERAVLITKEEFDKVLFEASEEFEELLESKEDGSPMVKMMMSMQNLAFGVMIGKRLFGESEDK